MSDGCSVGLSHPAVTYSMSDTLQAVLHLTSLSQFQCKLNLKSKHVNVNIRDGFLVARHCALYHFLFHIHVLCTVG